MTSLRILLIILISCTFSCQAQKSAVPSVLSKNVKINKDGSYYVEVDGKVYPMVSPKGISIDMAKPAFQGTEDGLLLTFKKPLAVKGIYYGFLPYDDSNHPMPVYRNFTEVNEEGKLEIDIRHLKGKYDMIGWVEKGMGSIGYRVMSGSGQPLYDGVITFTGKPEGPFSVANTIESGPTVNQVGSDSCVIAFVTNKSLKASVEVSRPGTRALTKIFIEKTNFTIKSILPKNQSFLKTLRSKLLWGEDIRNKTNL